MEAAFERLTQASHKLAEVMYGQPGGGAGPAGGPSGPGAGSPGSGSGASDEVIDAEYVEK